MLIRKLRSLWSRSRLTLPLLLALLGSMLPAAATRAADAGCAVPRLVPSHGIRINPAGAPDGGIIVGDFIGHAPANGLGSRDLAVLSYVFVPFSGPQHEVSILGGNGDGTYRVTPNALQLPGAGEDLTAADFNADGFIDLAVAAFSSGGKLEILLSRGDGTFQPPLTIPLATSAQSLVAADFNGDGVSDVAVAGSAGVALVLGNGDGTFRPAVLSPAIHHGFSVVAGDFDNDHHLDLAMVNLLDVIVLPGNGDGTFGSPGVLPIPRTQAEVISLATGDLDLDGRLDLVAASTGNGRVAVLLGLGDGTFRSAVEYGEPLDGDHWSGSPTHIVALGNVNGDSFPDVVVNSPVGGPMLLLGRGAGLLQPPVVVNWHQTEHLIVADVNHDGLDDVIGLPTTIDGIVALPLISTCAVVVPHSLSLNGSSYAEVAHAPGLNPSDQWTIETWFRDEDPRGFNHDYVTLLNKGDRASNPESPYFISLGYKRLVVGVRTRWTDYGVQVDLHSLKVDPTRWHHVAASFRPPARELTIYVDGVQAAQERLNVVSDGNTLPLQIGRNGPTSGRYLLGKLDDVRIWGVVRTGAQIAANYASPLQVAPRGLMANWQFDEASGSTVRDAASGYPATLHGGGVLVTDHP